VGKVFGDEKLTTAHARSPQPPRPHPHHSRPFLSQSARFQQCRFRRSEGGPGGTWWSAVAQDTRWRATPNAYARKD
jgi:hypothetical protein